MPFYMTPKNRPVPATQSSLRDRLYDATHQIIVDELDAGATSEELLGMMITLISNDIGEQTILRQAAMRRAERAEAGKRIVLPRSFVALDSEE